MTKYRYDQLLFSSVTANKINIGNPQGTIGISGSIASGNTQNFSTTITLSSTQNYTVIYGQNENTNNKTKLDSTTSVSYIYQAVSQESATCAVSFGSNQVTVTISVFNGTASTITLTSQNILITAVEYKLPF